MVEAAVTFGLIVLGVAAWAVAVVARKFYRGRPVRHLGDGARSDGGQVPHHHHHHAGQHHGSDVPAASHRGGDFSSGHHGGGSGTGGHH